jgi:glucose-1-phosphate adenylyltransferase
MDLLGENPQINPENWKVRTNLAHNATRDHPPAMIGPAAEIANSLIYNGCRINGKVTNSILFPGVIVGANTEINGSILMFNTEVGEEARLERVISDVETTIGRGVEIGVEGDLAPNREYPELLKSGITLIGRSCDIPSGIRIGKNCIVKPDLSYSKFKDEVIESGKTVG